MSSPTNAQVAGHPIAIRVGGRRMSQSAPIKSPSKSASSASSSPEDAHHGAPSAEATDYPRPRGDPNGGAAADGEGDAEGNAHGHQEEQGKRKNKKGIKSDEAKLLALNSAGSTIGRAPRKASMPGVDGSRIQQPSRDMGV